MAEHSSAPLASADSAGIGRKNGRDAKFSGPRIIALAFVTLNLATGITYGSFGVLVLPLTERFDARLSVVSLGMSLLVLSSGLLALVIGRLLNRFSIRAVMTGGAVLAAAGYALLAICTNIWQVLACYGLLIGPGVAFLGFLPSFTLVSRWYIEGQGRAFGIVGLSVVVAIIPVVTTALLPRLGFETVVLILAAGYLAALPFVALVIDRPEQVGQQPYGRMPQSLAKKGGGGSLTFLQVMRDPTFLLIALGSGLTVGPQTAKNVLLIPIVVERGFSVEMAAILLSVAGGSAMVGSLLFGFITDRIGPVAALILGTILQGLTWLILILPASFPLLVVDAVIMGACSGGFIAPKSVLVTRIFGSSNYPLVMGVSGLLTLPLLFGMPPLMGFVREATGGYTLAIILQIVGLCLAMLCFMAVRNRSERLTFLLPSKPTAPDSRS